MYKSLHPFGIVLFALSAVPPLASAQVKAVEGPSTAAEKPPLGDKDDAVMQNRRFLTFRNETGGTLSVFLQFKTMDNNVWTWVPEDPAKATDCLSFEVEAGQELAAKYKDEPIAASRMRIWAISPTQQWLKYKTKDAWLVPERNEDGEHVYAAPGVETYTFVFSASKDKGVIAPDSDMAGEQSLPTDGVAVPLLPPDIPWDDVPEVLPPWFVLVRDLAVLPVNVAGSTATVRVKNLGHKSANLGRRLILQKLAPGALPEDKGPIGPLFHYGVRTVNLIGMAPGNYVAFVSPGDDAPYDLNDKRSFTIAVTTHSDLAVMPATVSAGKVWLKVKNAGTANAAAGPHLLVMKLPGGLPLDIGPVGFLGVGVTKAFASVALAPGTYKAYLSPGDAAPYQANDAETFVVPVAADLEASDPAKVGALVKGTIHNNGPGSYAAGPRTWHIEKWSGGMWVAIPTVGSHVIPALPPGGSFAIQGTHTGAGTYRIRITAGDAVPANDVKVKMLP